MKVEPGTFSNGGNNINLEQRKKKITLKPNGQSMSYYVLRITHVGSFSYDWPINCCSKTQDHISGQVNGLYGEAIIMYRWSSE